MCVLFLIVISGQGGNHNNPIPSLIFIELLRTATIATKLNDFCQNREEKKRKNILMRSIKIMEKDESEGN